MSEPFIGEVRAFGFSFPPRGWAACQGQLLAISQNQALFSLLGTTFGGNGVQTFALPNLAGRAVVGAGANYPLGMVGGEQSHILTDAELPSHSHSVAVSNGTPTSQSPGGNYYGNTGTEKLYASQGPVLTGMVLSPTGGNQPHNNFMPSLSVNYCIALQGIFPSRP